MRTAATVAATVTALASLLTPLPAAQAAGGDRAGGRTHADNAPFREGCRRYSYGYRVRTPTDDWTLEVTILNPDGDSVRADAFLGKPGRQGDPRRRSNVRYRICDTSSRPGVYRIRAKLEWFEEEDDSPLHHVMGGGPPRGHTVHLPVERFRLHR